MYTCLIHLVVKAEGDFASPDQAAAFLNAQSGPKNSDFFFAPTRIVMYDSKLYIWLYFESSYDDDETPLADIEVCLYGLTQAANGTDLCLAERLAVEWP